MLLETNHIETLFDHMAAEERIYRGQMLVNFCERNGLIVTNTWFRKPKRRRYTWKAPGDRSRHQLDYIFVRHQFRKSVKDVQTLPGADIALNTTYWLPS